MARIGGNNAGKERQTRGPAIKCVFGFLAFGFARQFLHLSDISETIQAGLQLRILRNVRLNL
jgi:hypothetical protein